MMNIQNGTLACSRNRATCTSRKAWSRKLDRLWAKKGEGQLRRPQGPPCELQTAATWQLRYDVILDTSRNNKQKRLTDLLHIGVSLTLTRLMTTTRIL